MSFFGIPRFQFLYWASEPQIGVFAHMLATPLTVLSCNLENPARCHNPSKTILAALERMRGVIAFFTDSAQLPEPTQFKISELLNTLTVFYGRKLVVIAHQKITLVGQKFLLEEALFCLLNNALTAQVSESAQVYLFVQQKNKTVLISIRDFGEGISWWQKKLVILPHISFKKQGTGLGLPFAKFVIEKVWRGKLSITSQHNLGTEIICQLPLNH